MPLLIPRSRQEESLLSTLLSLESLDVQEDIEKEKLALRKQYQDIYGKQVGFLTSKKAEEAREAQRRYHVAQARGLTQEAKMHKLRYDFLIDPKNKDKVESYLFYSEIAKNMQAENYAIRQQSQTLRDQISMLDLMRRWAESKRKGIQDEVDTILSPQSGLAAEDALDFARQMKGLLSGERIDHDALSVLRGDIAKARSKQLDRQLKIDMAEEKRQSDIKMKETRESASLKFELDARLYDPASLAEINTARANSQPDPEVYTIFIDRQWPLGNTNFLYTERSAIEKGLHDKWLQAKERASKEVMSIEEFERNLKLITDPSRAKMYYDMWKDKVYKK